MPGSPWLFRLAIGVLALSWPIAGHAGEVITYTYDALGRLVTVQSSGDVNNGQTTSTAYDPAGNRTNRTVTGVGGALAQLSIGNASATEGSALIFTVTRSGVTTSAVSASYATSNGTAVAGSDYTAASGTVSFSAGQTSKTITVNTINDSTFEPTETMTVTLSNPSGGATITSATGTGTILDDDDTVIQLTGNNLAVLPAHQPTYSCNFQSIPHTGVMWGFCWLNSNNHIVYDFENGTTYELDPGYSVTPIRRLNVLSSYYGTSD